MAVSKITVNHAQAEEFIKVCIRSKLVPMVHGSPAIGKSSIVKSIAEQYNLELIDLRLAQCDPTDLLGFPHVDKEREKANYIPMETFPIEGDTVPEGKNGWLLFLDEFNSADRSVQKAAYKLVLDKMVGKYNLHKKVAIVCAGNLDTDNAIVEDMSTALQSRLVHAELALNVESWLDFALKNGFHHHITSFIQFKPDALYTFKADHSDYTYASPRTWEFVNSIYKELGYDASNPIAHPAIAGAISQGTALEFIGFTKIYKDLPKFDDILANPEGTKVPTEPSIQYALSGSLSNFFNKDNAKKLMAYIERLPVEFQVVTLREIIKRDASNMSLPALQDWIQKYSAKLF